MGKRSLNTMMNHRASRHNGSPGGRANRVYIIIVQRNPVDANSSIAGVEFDLIQVQISFNQYRLKE